MATTSTSSSTALAFQADYEPTHSLEAERGLALLSPLGLPHTFRRRYDVRVTFIATGGCRPIRKSLTRSRPPFVLEYEGLVATAQALRGTRSTGSIEARPSFHVSVERKEDET